MCADEFKIRVREYGALRVNARSCVEESETTALTLYSIYTLTHIGTVVIRVNAHFLPKRTLRFIAHT